MKNFNKIDVVGIPTYLVVGYSNEFGKYYKCFPHNVEAMTAHWETLQWLKNKNDKKSQAV